MKIKHIAALLCSIAPFIAQLPIEGAATPRTQNVTLVTELDSAVLSSRGNNTTVLKIGLLPDEWINRENRPPINLSIVLDRSGSMSGEKIEMARRAALQAFYALRSNDRVSIVSYSSDVRTVLPLTPVGQIANPHFYINQIRSGGGTAIYDGVNQGAAELNRNQRYDNGINRILLLSDGLANEGPSEASDFKLLGKRLSRQDITVSTIGLGLDYNEDLMSGLAEAGQGNVYFVENERDLPRIFEAELGDASSLVARNAEIEIDCLNGFTPLRIIGRDGKISGNKIIIEISHLYAGREKFVLIEVANPGGKSETTSEFAKVEARIQNSISGEQFVLNEVANAKFSDSETEQAESVNLAVKRAYVENRIAEVKDVAIELADRGDTDGAAYEMAELNTWIERENSEWQDDEISRQNLALEKQSEKLKEEGMDKKTRKQMRSSAYQSKSQQSYQ